MAAGGVAARAAGARMSPATGSATVSLSEVLAALSHALDLTEGQPMGHTIRSCLIGMRLAEELGLPSSDRSALYYALLLKDAGCSSNAARMSSLFGSDDRMVKERMKLADWHKGVRLAVRTAGMVGAGKSLVARAKYFIGIARHGDVTREIIQTRCDRGASIALRLGFSEGTAEAIRCLDEHWCGLGYPEGKCEEEIPLLARIASIAQTIDVFHWRFGLTKTTAMLRRRRGRWFDPKLVDMVLGWRRDREWWAALSAEDVAAAVVSAEPSENERQIDQAGLDLVAQAFGDIIDAKTPYTFRHSSGVASFAVAIAGEMGLPPADQKQLARAGLLHDIGKLGVSNTILDKPGRLTDEERVEVEKHPLFTWEILSRVTAFSDFAWMSALHHEKLDGTGYPWKLKADSLDTSARILAVADMYEAMTADRPYREGMSRDKALGILNGDRRTRMCDVAIDALAACTAA